MNKSHTYPTVLDFDGCHTRAECLERLRGFFTTMWDDATRSLQTDYLLDAADNEELDIDELDDIVTAALARKEAAIAKAVGQAAAILDRVSGPEGP